jgi:hypothetical protein
MPASASAYREQDSNMESEYYSDATSRVLQLLKDTFGESKFNWFDGVPTEDLPEGAFPCVIVHKLASTVELGATGQDKMRSQINVHFLLNEADDVNALTASGDQGNLTQKKLRQMIEGRDPATGQWKQGTALWALRTKIRLEGTTVELNADVQYDATPRPDLPTINEAIIQVIATELISVPLRT